MPDDIDIEELEKLRADFDRWWDVSQSSSAEVAYTGRPKAYGKDRAWAVWQHLAGRVVADAALREAREALEAACEVLCAYYANKRDCQDDQHGLCTALAKLKEATK